MFPVITEPDCPAGLMFKLLAENTGLLSALFLLNNLVVTSSLQTHFKSY